MVGFKDCYRDLVEMGAIKDDLQETNLGRKHALIVWFLNRHEQQAKTIRKIDRSAPFYQSGAWRKLRFAVLAERGGACQLCGAKGSDGARLHVDHIKPRSKFPDLCLDPTNMQVLCEDCNLGKADTVLV
jgi:5-methylcytosine-specific restriction endonuclease McrA